MRGLLVLHSRENAPHRSVRGAGYFLPGELGVYPRFTKSPKNGGLGGCEMPYS